MYQKWWHQLARLCYVSLWGSNMIWEGKGENSQMSRLDGVHCFKRSRWGRPGNVDLGDLRMLRYVEKGEGEGVWMCLDACHFNETLKVEGNVGDYRHVCSGAGGSHWKLDESGLEGLPVTSACGRNSGVFGRPLHDSEPLVKWADFWF